jgi:DNA-binding CsgD family transcriptional regulator
MQTQTETSTKRKRVAPPRGSEPTARELDCVRLAADGLSNKEIAGRLGIAKRSVDQHLYQAYRRLQGGRCGRMAAVNEFRRRGLLN